VNPPELTNKPATLEVSKNPLRTSDLEVTQVPGDFVIQPPQDVAAANPPKSSPSQAAAIVPNQNSDAPKADKRGLLAKLNPFGTKMKNGETPAPAPAVTTAVPAQGKIVVVNPDASATAPVVVPEPIAIPRYTYSALTRPAPGNRREAERYFAEGLRFHKAGQMAQAIAYYQRATQLDPAYFEAFYNQGLAAYDLGRFKQSLPVYEHALGLNPDSADARYNFALALKQAGYPADAASELGKILSAHPDEARSHYSLGNLYAHQLKQPREAREHYQKVLDLQPNHPRAAEIRFWLAANP
jgi:tetratricopeptide (TPR) repeat protein